MCDTFRSLKYDRQICYGTLCVPLINLASTPLKCSYGKVDEAHSPPKFDTALGIWSNRCTLNVYKELQCGYTTVISLTNLIRAVLALKNSFCKNCSLKNIVML